MIENLITSKTKIKLLLKFFLNPETKGYLRQLASEFEESTNGIRVELNKLSKAKIIESRKEGEIKFIVQIPAIRFLKIFVKLF